MLLIIEKLNTVKDQKREIKWRTFRKLKVLMLQTRFVYTAKSSKNLLFHFPLAGDCARNTLSQSYIILWKW